LSNQDIAKRLSIGEGTVKLKVTGRFALLLYAREHG
jgi:DNA-binding NarL/FixJ family response regulator